MVTLPVSELTNIQETLNRILDKSGVSEFKWKGLNGVRRRQCAIKMVELAVKSTLSDSLRVDVLIWDTHDARHNVRNRDDIANLQYMYYQIFRNVLRARWPDDAIWKLCPDEHTALDWLQIETRLEFVSSFLQIEKPSLTEQTFRWKLKREFGICEIAPVKSDQASLLQLADLFAGITIFSHEKFSEFAVWEKSNKPRLLPDNGVSNPPSNTSKHRFHVLHRLNEICKKDKLGVSLNSCEGLRTFKPENPLNFWMYKAQHPDDKAPAKDKK